MENRIAELFDECVSGGSRVVTVENVEAIIARMGKPEELNDAEEDVAEEKPDKDEKVVRHLFRNPDDKVLGGVASGIAAYLGWDVAFAPASDCGRMFFPVAAFGLSGGMDYYPSRADGYGKTADAGSPSIWKISAVR